MESTWSSGVEAADLIRRTIPRTGETVAVVGLGTWQTFDVGPVEYASRSQVLRRFVELGGELVDSSPMYGQAEAVVGRLAHDLHVQDRLFVATKVWTRGERAGMAQMEDSLAKLRVPQIDLMQVHNLVDVDTHLTTLRRWKEEGRIRYIGITHYTVDAHRDLEQLLRRSEIDFVQFNYSLAVRDAERRLLPMAAEHGVATLINRPFESGAVFQRAAQKPLPDIAKSLGCESWAQLFLKYVISHPAVTCVIPATANVQHVEQNMAAGSDPLPDGSIRAELARAWR
jgi:diketogulonate reductase-like aldo/keto reductase